MKKILVVVGMALAITGLVALPVLAHDGPEGAEWVMADWIFLTFAVFGGGALIAFILALRAGLLSNIEDAKYYMLTIDEPDYYS